MTIPVNIEGHPQMNFPDGTDPAVIQRTVHQIISGTHHSQSDPSQGPSPALSMAPASPPADPTPPTAGAVPYTPQPMSTGMGELRNIAEGLTFGNTDRIGAGIAKMMPGANADKIEQHRQERASDLAEWNKNNTIDSFISGAIGAASSMGAAGDIIGSVASKIAPDATSALSSFANQFQAAHPYLASAGAGAGTGALYGAAAANPGERGAGAVAGGVTGGLLGPAGTFVARNVVSPLIGKTGGALSDWLAKSEGEPADAAAMAPEAVPSSQPYSDITNKPLGASPEPEAVGPSSLTGKLPLSPGVKSGDANQLRIEENAKQGLLGPDAQSQMQKSNDAVVQTARNAMQQLKGVTNKDSDSLLSDSVTQFQKQANLVKSNAQALYKQRDAMMADAVLNKTKVGPSLGSDLSDVVQDPSNISGFKSKSGAPAKQLYQDFKALISGTKGRELPFSDLAAWRQDVAHLATTDMSTAGNMAGKLGKAYDNWMETISQDNFISGDAGIAAKAQEASSAWKIYKTLFGSENSPVIAGMVKPYDATPADFVNKVFGANVQGNGNTALNMRKMTAALPQEAQQQFKDNVFSGLVSRVFENSGNADQVSLANLRNNLSKLQDSQVFRENYAKDASKNTVITNLIKDLTTQITQSGRRDVTGPSVGGIMRGVKTLIGGMADTPIVNRIPGVKIADAIANKAGEMSQSSTDRVLFNAAMKGAAKAAHAAARAAPVFDFNALKTGVLGGVSAGAVVQTNKRSKSQ